MNEEEINLWFEEKKEAILKEYLKSMDALLLEKKEEEGDKTNSREKLKKQKLDDEEKKKLMREYGEKFVNGSKSLRDKYDRRILGYRKKEENKRLMKERIKKIFSPIVFLYKSIKKYVLIAFKAYSKYYKEVIGPFLFKLKSRIKRRLQAFFLDIKGKTAPLRLFYHQKIWPILHFINTPNRMLVRFVAKSIEKAKLNLKKIMDISKKIFGKIIKVLSTIFSKTVEVVKKIISKIVEIYQSVAGFFVRVYQYIKARYFPEKDD